MPWSCFRPNQNQTRLISMPTPAAPKPPAAPQAAVKPSTLDECWKAMVDASPGETQDAIAAETLRAERIRGAAPPDRAKLFHRRRFHRHTVRAETKGFRQPSPHRRNVRTNARTLGQHAGVHVHDRRGPGVAADGSRTRRPIAGPRPPDPHAADDRRDFLKAAAAGAAVDRHELAEDVLVADDEARRLALVLEVLRRHPEGPERVQDVVVAEGHALLLRR